MPIFDCHSFCSVPCNIQFHFCVQKMITLSVNINDKHELHNKFFIVFNLCFVPRVKDRSTTAIHDNIYKIHTHRHKSIDPGYSIYIKF